MDEAITDEFVATFKPTRASFIGPTARMVANGEFPDGVNREDPRVQFILLLCMIGPRIPACPTCRGTGVFSVSQKTEECGDCFGMGVLHPADSSTEAAILYARAARDGFPKSDHYTVGGRPATPSLIPGIFDGQAVTYVTDTKQPLAILLETTFLEANHERMLFADGLPLFVKDGADAEKKT